MCENRLRGHIPALDGVRGLAILMVLVVHFIGDVRPTNAFEIVLVQLASYGAMGVDVFFVLSGFLITGILFDTRLRPNYFRNFYMRRVLRIFPLYYGVLVAAVITGTIVACPDLEAALHHQGWLWAYSVNIFLANHGDWSAMPVFSHFWSLAVEEHFYLVWPLVVFFCDGRRLKVIAVLIACAALALRLTMVASGVNDLAVYVLTPCRLDGLAIGGFTAIVAREAGGLDRLRRFAPHLASVGAAFILGTFWLTRWFPQWQPVFHELRQCAFTLCFCSLLVFAICGPRAIRAAFESRFMGFFGKYSYGLYVFHFIFGYFLLRYRTEDWVARWVGSHTLAIFVQAVLAVLVAIAMSLISYYGFERHFLKLKVRF